MACPKLPALAVTSFVLAGIFDARNSAPRPLNDRIGLAVSTLTRILVPSNRDRESAWNCGVRRKTGSIASAAARMFSILRRCSIRLLAGRSDNHRDCGKRTAQTNSLDKAKTFAENHTSKDDGASGIERGERNDD